MQGFLMMSSGLTILPKQKLPAATVPGSRCAGSFDFVAASLSRCSHFAQDDTTSVMTRKPLFAARRNARTRWLRILLRNLVHRNWTIQRNVHLGESGNHYVAAVPRHHEYS